MGEGKGRRLQNDMERDEKNVIIRRKYFYIIFAELVSDSSFHLMSWSEE